uniref:Peptidase S1 domain-containing protein n=1 Tax=Eutreptiella gymnastica TaxID=73025 RepID=A0A7S1J8T7_9EUGL|mmetsp:Transcript_7482/g.13204  ORF Transcript_7482/g.13204 Transcript_7482/m.13204 type:complete len:1325 (+) Transcript_7482:75-4049(+)
MTTMGRLVIFMWLALLGVEGSSTSLTFGETAVSLEAVYAAHERDAMRENALLKENVHSKFRPQFVGGLNAQDGMFPFLVSIFRNGQPICAGTILSRDWILTSAFCTDPAQSTDNTTILAGSVSLNNPGAMAQWRDVDWMIEHPLWANDRTRSALSLMHLASPLDYSTHVKKAEVPHFDLQFPFTVTAMGWGSVNAGHPYYNQSMSPVAANLQLDDLMPHPDYTYAQSNTLKWHNMYLLNAHHAAAKVGNFFGVDRFKQQLVDMDHMLYTGSDVKGTCGHLDDGGPIVIPWKSPTEGQSAYQVAGVNIFRYTCTGTVDIHAKTFPAREWLTGAQHYPEAHPHVNLRAALFPATPGAGPAQAKVFVRLPAGAVADQIVIQMPAGFQYNYNGTTTITLQPSANDGHTPTNLLSSMPVNTAPTVIDDARFGALLNFSMPFTVPTTATDTVIAVVITNLRIPRTCFDQVWSVKLYNSGTVVPFDNLQQMQVVMKPSAMYWGNNLPTYSTAPYQGSCVQTETLNFVTEFQSSQALTDPSATVNLQMALGDWVHHWTNLKTTDRYNIEILGSTAVGATSHRVTWKVIYSQADIDAAVTPGVVGGLNDHILTSLNGKETGAQGLSAHLMAAGISTGNGQFSAGGVVPQSPGITKAYPGPSISYYKTHSMAQSTNEDTSVGVAVLYATAISGTVDLGWSVDHGTLSFGGPLAGSSPAATGSSTLSVANANLALAAITLNPAEHYNGLVTVTITITESGYAPVSLTLPYDVLAVNDAPGITVAYPLSTLENTAVTLAGKVQLLDVDSAAGPIKVTLQAELGTFTLPSLPGGVTVTGQTTSTAIVTGTLTNLQTVLDGLTFTPKQYHYGTSYLIVDVDDQGNTPGPARHHRTVVEITVTPINQPISLSQSTTTVTLNEDTPTRIPAVIPADIDSFYGRSLVLNVSISDGTISFMDNHTSNPDTNILSNPQPGKYFIRTASMGGYCGTGIMGNHRNNSFCCPATCGFCGGEGCENRPGGASNCCYQASLDWCSNRTVPPCRLMSGPDPVGGMVLRDILHHMVYTPPLNWYGTTTLMISVSDETWPDVSTASVSYTLVVVPVNDAPVITTPQAMYSVNRWYNLSVPFTVSDVDVYQNELKATVECSRCKLTITRPDNISYTGSPDWTFRILHPVSSDGWEAPGRLQFQASLSLINIALSTLIYETTVPNVPYIPTWNPHDVHDLDTITVTIEDLGHTGTGGARTTVKTVPLTVTAELYESCKHYLERTPPACGCYYNVAGVTPAHRWVVLPTDFPSPQFFTMTQPNHYIQGCCADIPIENRASLLTDIGHLSICFKP